MDRGKDVPWYRPILLKYGLRALKVKACSSVYKQAAAYHVTTDKGEFLLKPFIGAKNRLDRVYSRITWLTNNGYRNMPKWLKTTDGKHWVSNNGRLHYVSEWIKGSKPGEKEDEYARVGEALAQLHKISKSRESGNIPYSVREINRFREQHRVFAHHLAVIKTRGSSRWFSNHGAECLSMAEDAWKTLRHSDIQRLLKREKSCLIHGDVTTPNIIINNNEAYLVDWEFARRGSAYYEVAKTLNNVSNYSVPHMTAFLSGYEKISPLMPEERLIIASLFRLPREAWIAANQIRLGQTTSLYTILKKAWHRRLEAVAWLDQWATNTKNAS